MNIPATNPGIDHIIKLYGGWKAKFLTQIRQLVLSAHPDITEAVKWKMKTRPEGLPVWELNGNLCMVETFKNDMKFVFLDGPKLNDSDNLFNARLESSQVRAIALKEGDVLDAQKIAKLLSEAVQFKLRNN